MVPVNRYRDRRLLSMEGFGMTENSKVSLNLLYIKERI